MSYEPKLDETQQTQLTQLSAVAGDKIRKIAKICNAHLKEDEVNIDQQLHQKNTLLVAPLKGGTRVLVGNHQASNRVMNDSNNSVLGLLLVTYNGVLAFYCESDQNSC